MSPRHRTAKHARSALAEGSLADASRFGFRVRCQPGVSVDVTAALSIRVGEYIAKAPDVATVEAYVIAPDARELRALRRIACVFAHPSAGNAPATPARGFST